MNETDLHTVPVVELIVERLRRIIDPELAIDIVELGMVRDVVEAGPDCFEVQLCLTSLSCPVWDVFVEQVDLEFESDDFDVRVQFLTRPAWSPEWMSDDAREQLVAVGLLPATFRGQAARASSRPRW